MTVRMHAPVGMDAAVASPAEQEQQRVNAYFDLQATFWRDLYAQGGVYAEIHRARQQAVLDWIDTLQLPPDARVFDVGCGAGFLSVALAQRGWRVRAIDSVEAMVAQANRHAAVAGLGDETVKVTVGDATALAEADESFDLVIALGVLPWLPTPEAAMREMARVARPGGYVVLTADNRARLNAQLDPWRNPYLMPAKRRVKAMLARTGLRRPRPTDVGATTQWRRVVDAQVGQAGLVKLHSATLGFGPFTLLGVKMLPDKLGIAVHRLLQRWADRGAPVLRASGAQYLVVAQKPVGASAPTGV